MHICHGHSSFCCPSIGQGYNEYIKCFWLLCSVLDIGLGTVADRGEESSILQQIQTVTMVVR